MCDIDDLREQMDMQHFNEEAENIEYMDACLDCPICGEIILDDEDFKERVIYCECDADKYKEHLFDLYCDYFENKPECIFIVDEEEEEKVNNFLEAMEKKLELEQL